MFRCQVIPRRLLNHRILRKMLIKTQQTPFPAPGCKRPAVHSTWQRLHSPSLNAHEEDANHLETVRDFILLGSKITADGDCSHEIKSCWLLGIKADKPRQHIKKQRHYFASTGPSSQSYGFPSSHVWLWELDYKETEHWRIDAIELWCWRRLLWVA